jgi:acetyl esterase
MSAPHLSGRLGSPDMSLRDDPRADPRMIAAMTPFELDAHAPPLPVTVDSPIEAIHEYITATESAFEMLFPMLLAGLPEVSGVERNIEVIPGVDGNDITLHIHRPTAADRPTPGVLHIHGGGMVFLEAAGAGYTRWRDDLAATGMVVVGVEFRNGGGKHGPHPFPAGLSDCTSALGWMHANRQRLGISKLVVSGESGGGNLSLATALQAKRDGRLGEIDGVYAQCPYISNAYAARLPELPSLYENDGYLLGCEQMSIFSKLYDPSGQHATEPSAWPYHASAADLAGMPPHVISVNELDPLRDEGLAYFRKLLGAGVSAVSRTVNGTCHAGDCLFQRAIPDVYHATVRDIRGFAGSL